MFDCLAVGNTLPYSTAATISATPRPGSSARMTGPVTGRPAGREAPGGAGVDGFHGYAPDGNRLGQIEMPKGCANLTFVGKRRNRLFICGSQSVYTLYTATQGAHIS